MTSSISYFFERLRYCKYSVLFFICLLFTSCNEKKQQQKLIEDIQHFNIDTIKAEPVDMTDMTRADSCRYKADVVLRKYPEMYHATDNVQKEYIKWVECEKKFISIVLVGKDNEHKKIFRKREKLLDRRFEELNFIEPLSAILSGEEYSNSLKSFDSSITLDDDAYSKCYEKARFTIKDGLKSDKMQYSTDEMRTACEKARRAWIQYINSIPQLLQSMPQECVPLMKNAINRIKLLHYIDIRNYYFTYWSDIKTGFVIDDNATDEQIQNAGNQALNFCDWMEKGN